MTIQSFWKTDFSAIDAGARRLARFALQLLAGLPDLERHDSRHRLASRLHALIAPLLAGRETVVDDEDEGDLQPWVAAKLQDIRRHYGDAERRRLEQADGEAPVSATVGLLAELFRLDATERRLLDFVERARIAKHLSPLLRAFDAADSATNRKRLAALLAVDGEALKRALQASGSLRRRQLIQVDAGLNDLEDFVRASEGLGELLEAEPESQAELLALLIEAAPPALLHLADFPHLTRAAERLTAVLRQAATTSEAGVNALFYGPPGVGKTEFAHALAAACGLRLYRVRAADEDGEGIGRRGRLLAYQIAQRALEQQREALILFDEAEDVFSEDGGMLLRQLFGAGGRAGGLHKGWMNRLLEENAVPTLWITNDTGMMDAAFLRRFLLPLEFVTPPRAVRRRIAEHHLPTPLLSVARREALLDELADDDKLTPAQLASVRRVLELCPAADAAHGERLLREGLTAQRRLLHGSGLPARRTSATVFDPDLINLAGQLQPRRIAEALARRGRGTLCFYGPPGTGKTEFAHVLADALDRELVSRSVSDLVSKYVGETERNLAALFSTVDAERSILFLDEVDSLLRDRRQAQHSWEVSEVNELLQQMERYPGIFIAATNLVQGIDQAALRRFDFKLHFRPLNRAQRLKLFAREALGDEAPVDALPITVHERLAALDHLTVGDFANVCRQRELLGDPLTPEDFLAKLQQEHRWKERAMAD